MFKILPIIVYTQFQQRVKGFYTLLGRILHFLGNFKFLTFKLGRKAKSQMYLDLATIAGS